MSADLSAKARAIAADGYIRKPIDFPDLLRQLHGAVGRAAQQRLAAADRMAALGTLASGIAHEINNPLTYVIANLQTLAEQLPASTDKAMRELSDIVADALDGAAADPQARQAGADGVARPARGTADGRRAARGVAGGAGAHGKPDQAPRAA